MQPRDSLHAPIVPATWRDLARYKIVEALVGRRLVDAIPLNMKGDRLRVALTADDGSWVSIELRAK